MTGAQAITRDGKRKRPNARSRSAFRRVRRGLRILAVLVLLALVFADGFVRTASDGDIFASASSVPRHDFALVLGTSPRSRGGRPNPYFVRRIDAAVALYDAGAVRALVVSGDNANRTYNEPAAMKRALIERGVPEDRIWQDFAGLRTLDSIVRMDAVFGRPRFVVVSQRFHLERALFLADHFEIEAIGFAAEGASSVGYLLVRLREYPARVKALLDVYLLNTGPRFLGEPVDTELVEEP